MMSLSSAYWHNPEAYININELWIAFGTGTSLRYIAVHAIASLVGPEKPRSLPVFHAFTGCDTVSCFSGKGKKTAWITWMACEEATSAFLEFSNNPEDVSEECLRKLERFVVLLYDRTSARMTRQASSCLHRRESLLNLYPQLKLLLSSILEKQHTRVDIAGVKQLFQ